jgi:hypothetical protein
MSSADQPDAAQRTNTDQRQCEPTLTPPVGCRRQPLTLAELRTTLDVGGAVRFQISLRQFIFFFFVFFFFSSYFNNGPSTGAALRGADQGFGVSRASNSVFVAAALPTQLGMSVFLSSYTF